MKHAQYYRNIANGIARINQCIFACKLATTTKGTIFSGRFKYPNGIQNFEYGGIFEIKASSPNYRNEIAKDFAREIQKGWDIIQSNQFKK